MNKTFLLGLSALLCCFRAISGSFSRHDYPEEHLHIKEGKYFEIIQCRMCHIQFPGEKCSRGRGVCTGTKEDSCITGKIFKKFSGNDFKLWQQGPERPTADDGTLWLTFMGCEKNCANVNDVRWSVFLVNFRCCRSHDLCNEDF